MIRNRDAWRVVLQARVTPLCRRRRAFTLIEVLVVISIIGVLVALLIPAVQAARESARKAQCGNNLRQVGLALHGFENTFNQLPAATYGNPYNTTGPGGSPFTKLLPYLDQQPVANAYDWTKEWFSTANQTAVNTQLGVFLCPSSLGAKSQTGLAKTPNLNDAPSLTAATGDYSAIYSWGFPFAVPNVPALRDPWAVGALSPTPENATGIFSGGTQYLAPRLALVKDGASHTVVVVEQAAKTDRWISGNLAQSDPQSARTWAPWAGQGCTWILSYLDGGQDWSPTGLGPCNINCNNSQGVYSFHSGGANALFLDGSVQFLKEGIAAELLYAYVSRSRGELIGEDF